MLRLAFTPDGIKQIRPQLQNVPGCKFDGDVATFEPDALLYVHQEPGWLTIVMTPTSPGRVYRIPATSIAYVEEEKEVHATTRSR